MPYRKRLSEILIEQAEARGERAHAEEIRRETALYYAAEEARYGEYLVERGIVTPVELELGLARQCVIEGNLIGADVHARAADRALNAKREAADLRILELRTLALQFGALALPVRAR